MMRYAQKMIPEKTSTNFLEQLTKEYLLWYNNQNSIFILKYFTYIPKSFSSIIYMKNFHLHTMDYSLRKMLYSIIGVLLFLPQTIYAQTSHIFNSTKGLTQSTGGAVSGTGLGSVNPVDTTSRIISYVLTILAIIAVALIIYGGFIWLFSRGNEEEVKKAQGILKASVIGLLIILASYGIALYVFSVIESATNQGAIS